MSEFKNILIFDAFLGGASAYWFQEAIPGQFLLADIMFGEQIKNLHSKRWKEQWQFYNTRKPFQYVPQDIHLSNGMSVTGCLHVVDLDVYVYLVHSFIEDFGADGQNLIHRDMAGDDVNSIRWARQYGLPYVVLVQEDEEKLTNSYIDQIKRIYQLSDADLVLCINKNQHDTVLVALNQIAKHFEHQL